MSSRAGLRRSCHKEGAARPVGAPVMRRAGGSGCSRTATRFLDRVLAHFAEPKTAASVAKAREIASSAIVTASRPRSSTGSRWWERAAFPSLETVDPEEANFVIRVFSDWVFRLDLSSDSGFTRAPLAGLLGADSGALRHEIPSANSSPGNRSGSTIAVPQATAPHQPRDRRARQRGEHRLPGREHIRPPASKRGPRFLRAVFGDLPNVNVVRDGSVPA